MANKKKSRRLTLKKKADNKINKTPPEGSLSEREFTALPHDYGSFFVEDSKHEEHEFFLEGIVYVKHCDSEESGDDAEDNYWIGKVKEIRGDRPDNVWIRIEWFWSPQEVAEVIKSFDPTICGKYEKLSSNNLDIISVYCVVDHAEVKQFDEQCIYQESIGDGEWFTRYQFSYDGRKVTPKATHVACPICKIPYTPGVEKILHFCPRPKCCKFYHQSCLVKNGYVEKTRNHRVLETWPDLDRTTSVEEVSSAFHPRKKQKRDHPASKESPPDPLAGIPAELIAIAEQQIVRGTKEGGIVGNIASVAAARQLIYRTLIEGGTVPDDWDTRIDTSTAFSGSDTFPNCICPDCYSPI